MKRSLIFCAIALVAAMTHTVSAQVNIQLNLEFTDPNDESAGGTFELLAGSQGGGIAGVSVLADNVNNDAVAAGGSGFAVFQSQQVGTVVEIVTGHDSAGLTGGAMDVGLGDGTTGNVADDLFTGSSTPAFANNVLLASGTFGATRPSLLLTSGTLAAGANEFSAGSAAAAALGTLSVRGDSVATDGLLPGDANRDGSVTGADFDLLAFSFGDAGTTWNQGNFNSSADGTTGADFDLLAFNFGNSSTAPAIAAVPEPASIALITLGLCGVVVQRRRK